MAATMSGSSLLLFHVAKPAALTIASQSCDRIAALMLALSVPEPTTTASSLEVTSGESLEGDRTNATTLWLWASRAGSILEPTFPVMPSRRTFIVVAYVATSACLLFQSLGWIYRIMSMLVKQVFD